MNPILSVVVPSYNVEKFLDKGLSSYADERFNGKLEIIIVNDGSTDKTHDIAKEYVDKYPEIFVLIDKENGGHGSAVNAGIDNAHGKYFRIIDGDDWVNTENLLKLLDIMENSDADIIVDNKREVNMVTGDTEYFPMPKNVKAGKLYDFSEVCLDEDVTPNIMIHTMSISTDVLKRNNIHLLEGIFYVDIEFIIKSTVKSETIQFTDLEVYQYLVGNVNQSVSFQNYVKRFEHHSKVTRELIRFATDFDESITSAPDVYRQYLDRRVCLLINTHMNIALIYDSKRLRGLARARDFRSFLKGINLNYYTWTEKRYKLTLMLHFLGVNYKRLEFIKNLKK